MFFIYTAYAFRKTLLSDDSAHREGKTPASAKTIIFLLSVDFFARIVYNIEYAFELSYEVVRGAIFEYGFRVKPV